MSRLCISCGEACDNVDWRCPVCFYEPQRINGHLAFAPELAEESEGFEADFFPRLFELEAGNFWFRSRNRLLVWALRRYFPEARNFLEIGCGTGYVLSGIRKALPELNLSGSEIYAAGLSLAAERLPAVELFQMDARRMPFKAEFDVIGAFDVLEHLTEDEEVLAQMFQATRPGGGIILTLPHHPSLWSQADNYAHHVRRYTTREAIDKVTRAGFEITRTTSFVSLLLPLMFLSRIRQRTQYDPMSEFKISPVMNAVFEKTLDVERLMIQAGLSFPLGGSLLLLARRR
jgi:SAM-dependent methyltransferase